MASQKLSLINFLKQPNPKVCSEYAWEGSNTRSANSAWKKPDHIRKWEDFEYTEVSAIFGDLLKREIDQQKLPDFGKELPFHLTEIRDEDSLEALLVRWNNAVVSTALSVAQRGDRSADSDPSVRSDEIFMARGGQGWIPNTVMGTKALRPDWAGIQANKIEHVMVNRQKRTSYKNVLPGDSKLSTKWKSELYEANPYIEAFNDPFKQIFTYCKRADARYGYLLTQEELVVVRVSREDGSKGNDRTEDSRSATTSAQNQRGLLKSNIRKGLKKMEMRLPVGMRNDKVEEGFETILEYKRIGWEVDSNKAPNELTVNLALWCLHMMAKRDGLIGGESGDLRSESMNLSFSGNTSKRRRQDHTSSQRSSSTSTDFTRKKHKRLDTKVVSASFRSDVSMLGE